MLQNQRVIQSLEELERYLGATRSTDLDFFMEWRSQLPPLNEGERPALDIIRDRFRYQRKTGNVAEGAVNAIVISPILALAGFYDSPFHLRSEASISVKMTLEVENETGVLQPEILRGRMDFLVLQDQFWQAVIESKETTFDIEMGIPQILAYMMGAPSIQKFVFGMVTNGNHFMFIKLQRSPKAKYSFSNTFSMLSDLNQLYDVLQILKQIGTIALHH